MSPYRRPTRQNDFRDAPTRAADKRLSGAWWRCPVHALIDDPIILAGFAFCSDVDCIERVVLAHSCMEEKQPPGMWNQSYGATRGVDMEDLR